MDCCHESTTEAVGFAAACIVMHKRVCAVND